MEVVDSLDRLKIEGKSSIALGNFDGVHVGHQKIMENALEAAEDSMTSVCFTFSNHPLNYILYRDPSDPAAVKLICDEKEKIRLIADMGFDVLVNVPFDETMMTMCADDFFETILMRGLNAGFISVGFNYTYGARAEGQTGTLMQECARAGIGIHIEDAVKVDDKVVSSTLIRETIKSGDMELTKRYLGRPLVFSGKVEHGRKIGSANGMPTANISIDDSRIIPPNGVYFSRTIIEGREYPSISNIGKKPTVQKSGDLSIETHIFDFDDTIYGRDVFIQLDHFSRSEKEFASKDDLFNQIRKDCVNASDYYRIR